MIGDTVELVVTTDEKLGLLVDWADNESEKDCEDVPKRLLKVW